ncbi:MAG TPA: ABC transporter substrate-binding protein [Candidatus Acidoferrum sp.]|nr:ABC transporter substrate-binding protein [Candidatus Acidoferrum sp.]
MKKYLALLLAAIMVLAMLGGCAPKEEPAEEPEPETPTTLKVGVLAPLTGGVAVYGTASANGTKLAAKEINAAGGINGMQIELEVMDEKGDVTEAMNAYNLLMEKGIMALIGDVTTKPCLAVADLALEDGIPMITPTGTGADITLVGPNIFRTCFIDPTQGKVMATFAAENLAATKVAVMYNTSDDYSSGCAAAFKAKAEELGLEVVDYLGYGADDQDFRTQLTTLMEAQVDAIFCPDYYNTDALIAVQAREIGYTGALLGADGWDGVIGATPEDKVAALNNCFFANHYSTEDTNPVVVNFLAAYKTEYSEDANSFAALGYDTMYILKAAIEKAGSTDSDAIVAALNEISVECVTGTISFDENGDPIKTIAIVEIKDGANTLNTKVEG